MEHKKFEQTTQEKVEDVYSPKLVEKLLRNYRDIRYSLDGKSITLPDTYAVVVYNDYDRVPLGMTVGGASWPFMEKKRATKKVDGKANARLMEELHVSALDIEEGLSKLSEEDRKIVTVYFIDQIYTLEELCLVYHVVSRGSMQQRCQRIVNKLTRIMNNKEYKRYG